MLLIYMVTKRQPNVQKSFHSTAIATSQRKKRGLLCIEFSTTIALLKRAINLSQTPDFSWATDFFNELKHQRKFALRLGRLAEEQALFNIKPDITKKLLSGKISISDLTEKDFSLSISQKGVDMRIGVDISSLAFKKQVDRIILISGDSDFVPAAKQARREGIDFILDPMRSPIKDDLFEHIDGIRTKARKLPNTTSK